MLLILSLGTYADGLADAACVDGLERADYIYHSSCPHVPRYDHHAVPFQHMWFPSCGMFFYTARII